MAATVHVCPTPDNCPHGPKRVGYRCLHAFKLNKPDGQGEPEFICASAKLVQMKMKMLIADLRSSERPGIITAQVGPPPPPENINRG